MTERGDELEKKPAKWLTIEREENGLLIEIGEHAFLLPVPRTWTDWLAFAFRRGIAKVVSLAVGAVLLTLFGFVNCMDVMLGVDATPSWLRYFAKGKADRVKIETMTVHRHGYGRAMDHVPRKRALMVLGLRSEVKLGTRVDIVCEMVGPGGFVDGYVQKKFDPDDLPRGIPADELVEIEIDFPEEMRPYGKCKVVEAR